MTTKVSDLDIKIFLNVLENHGGVLSPLELRSRLANMNFSSRDTSSIFNILFGRGIIELDKNLHVKIRKED